MYITPTIRQRVVKLEYLLRETNLVLNFLLKHTLKGLKSKSNGKDNDLLKASKSTKILQNTITQINYTYKEKKKREVFRRKFTSEEIHKEYVDSWIKGNSTIVISSLESKVKAHLTEIYKNHIFSDCFQELIEGIQELLREHYLHNYKSKNKDNKSKDIHEKSKSSSDEHKTSTLSETDSLDPFEDSFQAKGIKNVDKVTCYISSSLQALLSIKEFRNFFAEVKYTLDKGVDVEKEKNKIKFWIEISSLIKNFCIETSSDTPPLIGNTSVLVPESFRDHLVPFGLAKSEQQDAEEFLSCLLTQLQEEIMQNRQRNVINYLFQGALMASFQCKNCPRNIQENQVFYILRVHIAFKVGRKKTLSECLTKTLENKIIKDFFCDCRNADKLKKKQGVSLLESTFISSFPKILIIQLMRFNTEESDNPVKSVDPIEFSQQFEYQQNEQKAVYRLISIICHYGTLHEGHYTAYRFWKKKWLYFDDETVTEVKIQKVLDQKNPVYLLFYRKTSGT